MTSQVLSTVQATISNWTEGLSKLRTMRPPLDYGGLQVPRWKQLVVDAERFLDRWEEEARALGWTTLDLFGCDRVKPYARIDLAGPIPLLNGQPVLEMTAEAAMISTSGQRHTRFTRRRMETGRVALWDLVGVTS